MFSLFKPRASAEEFALGMWTSAREWPAKHGSYLREHFDGSFDKSIEEVFDEMVYFLAFGRDYAIWCQLEKAPQIRSSVRRIFMEQVWRFAEERRCPPIPYGEESAAGLIPKAALARGEHVVNLERRFILYGQSLSSEHDKSAGERTAYVLASLCGTLELTFIAYATPLFLGSWQGVQAALASFNIKS